MSDTSSYFSDKFIPASLPEVYAPRRALLADMYAAAEDGFIYITAPAGSGKTVSALLWLQDCKRPPVWISLDEYDNALSVFYRQIAAGLCSTQPDNAGMRAVYDSDAFSASPVEQTISLISAMRADETRRVLALDDMHLITNQEIIKSLPFVIKRLKPAFVTMILSRTEIPGTLRPLIKNERQTISADHLRFTGSEIGEYYKSLGLTVTPEQSDAARAATNGWAIGINAIAQSGNFDMKQGSDMFAAYFEQHIWNTWDKTKRDFCLCTCVADELSTALAARLTGRDDAADILGTLFRTNTFVSRLHDDTYRYHHLLTDFLRGKLDDTDSARLYKIAADYYMEKKDYSMALRYWLGTGDYKNADKFLLHFMFYNHHGDIPGYVDFLRMYFIREFPGSAFRDLPALHVCCAWYYYMTSRYKEYEYHADEGYRHIARIALYDAKFVEFAMLMYSVDHRSEMIDKIKRFGMFGRLIKNFSSDGIIRYIASFTHNLPYLHRSSFDYTDVLSKPEHIAKMRKSVFMSLLGDQRDIIISIGISGAHYEKNELDAALGEINTHTGTLGEQNSIELRMSLMFLRHSILSRMERDKDAAAALADMTDFVKSTAQFFHANFEAYKTRLALQSCDKDAARAWLSNYYVVDTEHIELYLVYQHFTTARAHMVLGDEKNARRCLTLLREFGQSLNRVCDFCEASILLSALEWTAGNKNEAAVILEDALERLQRYGYTRMVIDEGSSILLVLKRIAAKIARPGHEGVLSRGYIGALAVETHRFAKKYKGITAGFDITGKPVKLSRQQANMLTLLSRGYSNAMITEETGLKITTVKTHTAIAYQKLGVNNVMDAVHKARELGLI